jgi:hypothetical protein
MTVWVLSSSSSQVPLGPTAAACFAGVCHHPQAARLIMQTAHRGHLHDDHTHCRRTTTNHACWQHTKVMSLHHYTRHFDGSASHTSRQRRSMRSECSCAVKSHLCQCSSIPVCQVPQRRSSCLAQRRPAAAQRQQQQRQVLGGRHCPWCKQDQLLSKQHLF